MKSIQKMALQTSLSAGRFKGEQETRLLFYVKFAGDDRISRPEHAISLILGCQAKTLKVTIHE